MRSPKTVRVLVEIDVESEGVHQDELKEIAQQALEHATGFQLPPVYIEDKPVLSKVRSIKAENVLINIQQVNGKP